jgi:hypothetical protein
MSGHTPGPWQARNDYGWDTIIGNVDGPDDGEYTYTGIAEVITEDPGEAQANARLIAAAPELLEALQRCTARLEIHMKHSEDLAAHMQAAAAIAKATGETA